MPVSRQPQTDYDCVLSILSQMELSKSVALVTICQNTGIKLADVIRFCKLLESRNIISQRKESGNTFITLLTNDYDEAINAVFPHKAETPVPIKKQIDSRQAILERRKSMRSAEFNAVNPSRQSPDDARENLGERRIYPQNPLSAVDLLSIKRNSSSSFPAASSKSAIPAVASRSSLTNKAVYVSNRDDRSAASTNRSSFTGLPAAQIADAFERSDANFKQVRPEEHYGATIPLIPTTAMPPQNNEIQEQEVFDKLKINSSTPFLAVLTPRPTHEVWEACSALANIGGGVLALGMRKYIQNNSVTYFIKSVNDPDDAIKRIMSHFGNRDIISDSPKDASFIETVDFGRKTVLVLRISPELFSSMPLYLSRDSYGRRTDQGCYLYRNGIVQQCSIEETQKLWEHFRLGQEIPDWNQTGEIYEVTMEQKTKVSLPPMLDESVRPLSSKSSSYGQPIQRPDLRFSRRYKPGPATEPPIEEDTAQEQSPLAPDSIKQPKQIIVTQPAHQLTLFDAQEPAPAERKKTERKSTERKAAEHKPVSVIIPPTLDKADKKLIEQIAEPAVSHTRLPSTRLCEIAADLLKQVRLTPQELADVLQRKLPVIRTKILPALRENYKFTLIDNTYFIDT